MGSKHSLVWIDLEMTGLHVHNDVILEVAAIITDDELHIYKEGPDLIIYQHQDQLDNMGPWVKSQHTSSGLLASVATSQVTISDAEHQLIDFVQNNCLERPMLCGNTIWQDRLFLRAYMPNLEKLFHYRMIDVTSIKELVRRWYADNPLHIFKKRDTHRALDDIKESIAELAYYKAHFFI